MSNSDEMYAAAEEIRNQAVHLNIASENWTRAWQNIRAVALPDDALGNIGKDADFVSVFNSCAEQTIQKLWHGAQALGSGVNGLHQVANNYEHNEFRVEQDVKSVPVDPRPDLGLNR